jgi:hypothetical protein
MTSSDTATFREKIAAVRVQKALARVLLQQHYPRRIACATPWESPEKPS